MGMLLGILSLYALLACVRSQCEPGWRPRDGRCYYFSVELKSWDAAHASCLSLGGDLMSIQTYQEAQWLRSQLDGAIYWMGLNDRTVEGQWEWTDGSPFIEGLVYWLPGQPDNWGSGPGEDCGEVAGTAQGLWNDEACGVPRQYICKVTNPNPPVECDLANGWSQFQSSCYKLKAGTTKSWLAARYDCLKEGGDLVSLTSPQEEDFVLGKLDQSRVDLWLGFSTLKCNKLSCQVETGNQAFSWSDSSPSTWTNWAPQQPSPIDPLAGTCAALIKDAQFGKWRAHACRYERPYMCKRQLNTICPAGWQSFAGSCYWLVSNTALLTTWHEAQTRCTDDFGAHLVIINSQEEQYFINGFLPDLHHIDIPDLWIGLSDKDTDGTWAWVDRSPLTLTNWGPGWPQNTANMWDCGQIYTGNYAGKWETTTCFKSLAYMCEMTGGQNVKPTQPPGFHCDPGYLLYGDFCYHFDTENTLNWQEAESYCVNQQGHLVSFHSQEELSFLTAHMPGEAWVGLNDINTENTFVYTDGTPADFLTWAPNQPDNWQNNEDCVQLRGMNHHEPGKLNDDFCTSAKEFVCKKAKGQGPPQPPTSGPGWNNKCGFWTPDPFNDYCYLFNYLSMRPWGEARSDCLNQGGDLVSITDPYEQAFLQGMVSLSPTGISMWMGGHDSITEGGWGWVDGAPFRYVHWSPGNPDNYYGEDCLSMLINSGKWNDDKCEYNRGYICKRRGNTPEPPPPHDGFMSALACQGSSVVLHCERNSVINIQSAFYGRDGADICPLLDGSGGGQCTVPGALALMRKTCDKRPFCFAYAHMENDPCPQVSKFLRLTYSCVQNVCLRGLGVEDRNITDSQLSASSSQGSSSAANKARLNGNSCWMPAAGDAGSWIQVNLGQVRKVTGVVIQGCPHLDRWVTKFRIQHALDGADWKDYTADGEFFPGSRDRNTAETQLLGTPVSAKYVRVLPLEHNVGAGLRFDVLGCTPDYAVTCANRPNFNFASDRMTVHCPAGCAEASYRVYGTSVYRGDSNICAAAVHAGVVVSDVGGDCTLLKLPGQDFYTGSTRNGVTSRQFDGTYSTSYTFADGELQCSGLDWYEFGGFCYKPVDEQATWHGARHACRSVGAELVSILSATEQSWLESYLYMATSNVWTGLHDPEQMGFYIWSDGHMTSFTHWAPGEPNNHNGFKEDCVEMLYETGRWNDVACTQLNTYICKAAKAHYPLPPVEPTQYGCPQGWDAYGYACYWLEENPRSWSEAKDYCKEQGGFLLHIGDVYEQAHFTVALSGKTGFWWMGLRARGQAGGVDYIWDNGSPLTFSHWDRDQPDSGDGTCVAMTTGAVGGFWDDKSCSEGFSFVCEKPRPDITPPTEPPTAPPSGGCADSWTSLSHFRFCYKLFHNMDYSGRKSWGAAQEDCVSRGANLVSIHNQEVEQFLSIYTKGTSKWIGLSNNPTQGGYTWSDGTPLSHTNWGPGEPNNHEGRENCVEMVSSANGTFSWWNDLNCDAHQDWICMIPKGTTPIVPPSPPPPVPAPDCGVNPGWRKNGGVCYYYNDTDVVDFHTALHRCYQEKALLVSILSPEEQAYVSTMVGTGQVSAAWIGLRQFGITGGQYMWVDRSPLVYTHWATGEPNNANGEEQCVQMYRHQGGWNDANCGRAAAGYVCKKLPGDHHTPAPPTPPWEGHCPPGWLRFRDKCFVFTGQKGEVQANWSYARSWCQGQGGDLAVIDDQYENDFVSSYLKGLERPAWIGLSDLVAEDRYAWGDGSPVLYVNWDSNEPNNHAGAEHCVSITHNYLVSGKWNDAECSSERSFVCYRKKSSSIAPPPPTQSPCPDGYVSWKLNCYRLVLQADTWEGAQRGCAAQGGNLASVDMSYDQAFVAGVVLQGSADAWIGLRRKTDSYSWTDGWPVLFTHWGPGEPSYHQGEGCVSMHGSALFHGTWNDTRCDEAKPYICKISSEPHPPTPAPGNGRCTPFWEPYGGHCYFVYNGEQGFSWPESRHFCQLAKAELVSIHSRAELLFLRQLNFTKHHVWIGLTRDSNFGWAWTDDTAVAYVNWADGEPNEAFHPGQVGEENCVEMYPDGRWNDNNCLQKRGFACRHRQFGGDGGSSGTSVPPGVVLGGQIAGGIVGGLALIALIAAAVYVVKVRGIKISNMRLPTVTPDRVDVPAFTNPNFAEESES